MKATPNTELELQSRIVAAVTAMGGTQAKVADFAGLKRVQYLNTQGQIETRLGMNLLDLAQRMERAAARRAAR